MDADYENILYLPYPISILGECNRYGVRMREGDDAGYTGAFYHAQGLCVLISDALTWAPSVNGFARV